MLIQVFFHIGHLTTVRHLEQIVLSEFLEHASFNLHKLCWREEKKRNALSKTNTLMPRYVRAPIRAC